MTEGPGLSVPSPLPEPRHPGRTAHTTPCVPFAAVTAGAAAAWTLYCGGDRGGDNTLTGDAYSILMSLPAQGRGDLLL